VEFAKNIRYDMSQKEKQRHFERKYLGVNYRKKVLFMADSPDGERDFEWPFDMVKSVLNFDSDLTISKKFLADSTDFKWCFYFQVELKKREKILQIFAETGKEK
jgi:hypothetical protein